MWYDNSSPRRKNFWRNIFQQNNNRRIRWHKEMPTNSLRHSLPIWNDWKTRSSKLFIRRRIYKTIFGENRQNHRWRNTKNYSTIVSRVLYFTLIKKRINKRVITLYFKSYYMLTLDWQSDCCKKKLYPSLI